MRMLESKGPLANMSVSVAFGLDIRFTRLPLGG
jgi:hypothetical protein